MIAKGNRENAFRDYLVGRLAEDVKEELEKRLMTEDRDYQELLLNEDELVDDYVSGALSEEVRERFETHFLCTPERRRKLRFAAILREYLEIHWKSALDRRAPARTGAMRSFLKWLSTLISRRTPVWSAATAALLLAVATGVWPTAGYLRLQNELGQVSVERGALRRERQELQEQLTVERARAAEAEERRLAEARRPHTSEAVAITLIPGLLRASGTLARIAIPPTSNLVRLKLEIGLDEFPSYRAALHEAEGDEIGPSPSSMPGAIRPEHRSSLLCPPTSCSRVTTMSCSMASRMP